MTLALDGVSLSVGGETYLDDISLTLPRGSLNVLLGATLAGKTSLMRLMAGLDVPSTGRVIVDGTDVTGWPVRRRSVAMVYQQFINYPSLTVYENIASPLRVARLPRAEIESRVAAAASLMRLGPYLDRRPLELSGGQQQRTAIARALVKRADLVLMDEPLANLDYKLREELREELPRLFAESNAVFVYATTEPAEALLLGGNTATLVEGRLTAFGPTASVYRRPPNLATARAFSDPPLNTVPVIKEAGRVRFPGGAIAGAEGALGRVPDGAYTLGFRAHQLALAAPGPNAIPFPAVVGVVEITGSESFVHLTAFGHALTALLPGVHRLEPDTEVTAYLDPTHVFLFDEAGRLAGADLAQAA